MSCVRADSLSPSLERLRRLRDSFGGLTNGRPRHRVTERKVIAELPELGATAVPLLGRMLRAEDDSQASWAYFLMFTLGGERVARAARELARDPDTDDEKRILALALLADIGAELPEDVELADPERMCELSVRDLVDSLRDPGDIARAADVFLDQLGDEHLAVFMKDVADTVGAEASPLLDELLLRDDLPRDAARKLAALRERLPDPWPAASLRRRRRQVQLGAGPDGSRVILVSERQPDQDPPRLRALAVEVSADGELGWITYRTELVPRSGRRQLEREVAERGYVLADVRLDEAAHLVATAARTARRHSGLPREYYLGRDLLDLTDEHLAWSRRRTGPVVSPAGRNERST